MTVRFQFELSDEDADVLVNIMLDYLQCKELPEMTSKGKGYSSDELEAIKRQGKRFRENVFNVIMNGKTNVTQ